MRKHILTSIVLLPSLLTVSHAAQNWATDPPAHSWSVFSSEEGGTSSYLGVDIADVTTERLGALKLKEEKGVEVTMVDQDAPAGKAGIKEHDVILTMNGNTVESGAQLRRMIHEMPPGRVVSFGLSRDGQPMTVKVQLADKHGEFTHWPNSDVHVKIPDIHFPEMDFPSIMVNVVTTSARSGLSVENITPQLGEFFGVKNGNGVLVRAVEKGSRAEKAGIRAGDVIVKVNDQPVHDTSDFAHAVKSQNGKSISVGVIREKKEQNLNLTLPESKESGELIEDEESFDGPLMDADAAAELSEAGQELAELRPDMALVKDDLSAAAQELREALCDGKAKVRKQGEKAKQEFKLRQDQFKKSQEKLKMELDQLLQESRSLHSFDI